MPPRTTTTTSTSRDHTGQDQTKLNWLRNAVKQGLDEIEQGLGIEFSSMAQLEEAIHQIATETTAHTTRQVAETSPPARKAPVATPYAVPPFDPLSPAR